MIDFAGLATAAAVGTGTRPLDTADLPPEITAAIGAPGDPAELLLAAAAAWAGVGRTRVAAGPDLPPLRLPAPTRLVVPADVVALVRRIRGAGAYRDALQREVLAALGVRGLTLPPDLLLELLAEVSRAEVARGVAGLLDERGWALVGLDAVWSAALAKAGAGGEAADLQTWAEGSAAQRTEYLAVVRAADPDAGRALLDDQGFAREPAETRELFVRQLATGLGDADEEFLEARLGDRAKGVREAAAGLLSRLRGSAYVARAEALAGAHVQRRPRMLRAPLTTVAPVPVTAQTRRDQYRDRDADHTPAERLHLLDVIGIVPTDRWPALVGASAAELVDGPAEYQGSPIDLGPAFAAAALRWRDADLAEALVARDRSLLVRLLPVLPPGRRDALVAAALTAGANAELLDRVVRGPMPPQVAVAALEALRGLARTSSRHRVSDLVAPLAVHADPLAAPALVAGLRDLERRLPDDAGPGLRRAIGAATAALQLRQAVAEALLPYPVRGERQPGRPTE